MVQVDGVTGERVSVTGSVDAAPAQFVGLLVCQVPLVPLVEHTIRKCATGTNGEQIALEPGSVRVDVEDCGTL